MEVAPDHSQVFGPGSKFEFGNVGVTPGKSELNILASLVQKETKNLTQRLSEIQSALNSTLIKIESIEEDIGGIRISLYIFVAALTFLALLMGIGFISGCICYFRHRQTLRNLIKIPTERVSNEKEPPILLSTGRSRETERLNPFNRDTGD